jgi:glutamine amidotransferase
MVQSNLHPDGWGVAYYINQHPHIVKSSSAAINCNIFKKVSGVVSSNTVLAHIRNTTLGANNILNTHPFQFGNWVFAHNGNIKNFDQVKDQIKEKVSPILRRHILGETDSELIFYFLLSELSKKVSLDTCPFPIEVLTKSIRSSVKKIVDIVGPYSQIDDAGEKETYLTFILTNGTIMLAHQGGKNLHYSTYKSSCGEKDSCPHYAKECEAKSESGFVNHLIFSSEPLKGENIWLALGPGDMVAVDHNMILNISDGDQ